MYHSRSSSEGDSLPEDSSVDDADVLFEAGSDMAPGRIISLYFILYFMVVQLTILQT
jgi:hypothetical protein